MRRGNQNYNADRGILEPEEDEAMFNIDDWETIMVEVTFDPGACRHVMAPENAPGHSVQDSNASRRGLGFIVGNAASACQMKATSSST